MEEASSSSDVLQMLLEAESNNGAVDNDVITPVRNRPTPSSLPGVSPGAGSALALVDDLSDRSAASRVRSPESASGASIGCKEKPCPGCKRTKASSCVLRVGEKLAWSPSQFCIDCYRVWHTTRSHGSSLVVFFISFPSQRNTRVSSLTSLLI